MAERASDHGGKADQEHCKPEAKPPLPEHKARWPFVIVGLVLVAFAAAVLFIVYQPHPDVWTDDATVTVHYATVAPRVAGQIATVQVNDNQFVKAGQVLATIDPRDLQAAVDIAGGMLAQDRAQFDGASANVRRQPPVIGQQQAALAAAEARLAFARADARRFTNLAAVGAERGSSTSRPIRSCTRRWRTSRAPGPRCKRSSGRWPCCRPSNPPPRPPSGRTKPGWRKPGST